MPSSCTQIDRGCLINLYELVESDMISLSMYENFEIIDEKISKTPDYFSFLSRSLDENFYSDFIVAIINFKFSNEFGIRVLLQLCKACGLNLPKSGPYRAYREVPLGKFGDQENAQKRIDILVDLGKAGVLIIENKTKSREHGAQTELYYNAIKELYPREKIYCLFLTITGDQAQS